MAVVEGVLVGVDKAQFVNVPSACDPIALLMVATTCAQFESSRRNPVAVHSMVVSVSALYPSTTAPIALVELHAPDLSRKNIVSSCLSTHIKSTTSGEQAPMVSTNAANCTSQRPGTVVM